MEVVLTRVVLVRHGQTAWNQEQGERLRGRADLDLNEEGQRQAKLAALRLTRWGADAIYSSPLLRAMTTARIIAEPLNLAVQPLEGLIDIDYGQWQGLSLEDARRRDPALFRLWRDAPHQVSFPEGEGLEDVRQRVLVALSWTMESHKDQTVVLVSHNVVCRVLMCAALGLENSHFWMVKQDLTAINVIEDAPGGSTVTLLNDTCHLRQAAL